ncbi:TonB-dependent receptor plug domain-containing protein [Granulicella mallensis]|uniref:Iron complex outermembrane receptor protein/vitamin B12 transporter n=1 Tax=Granulicella mallensis TaxID=940614 RepID=A0A7W8ECY7_9BACT|nr:TonB-dependent receptor plug domain-containing protein [Granulicella mallensis]MBB5066125.1 iron complex outermembrane receptor protein/vitamin B12 transporter [Granulicella mallensis]
MLSLSSLDRPVARLSLRAGRRRRSVFALLLLAAFGTAAHAVIVRGHVTDVLGRPVPGARVQLIESGKVSAIAYSEEDGSYEIRYAGAGRFILLGSIRGFFPSIGEDFYSGTTDVLEKDVVMATNTVRQEVSVAATGIPTPLPQLTAPVSVIQGETLDTRLGVVDEMRQIPGAFLVQTGQTGGVTSLFLRGGNSTANLVMIDGVPADDVGGTFDFGTVSSTAVGRMELLRGPDSAMYGTDAGSSVISIETPRGTTAVPLLTYSGDAGNLHTWRNEATLSGTLQKFDYFGAVSRLDTSNALQLDRYHSVTSALNLGYDINGNTQVRFTIRNADSATGVPGPHDFWGISDDSKLGDQDLYSGLTLENRYKGNWHNLFRYSIARKREQQQQFGQQGTPITFEQGQPDQYTEYFGPVVTIRGANGYTATGQTEVYGDNTDQDSNRDQLYYQSDYSFSRHFIGLFGFRYDNERGSFNDADIFEHEKTQRTNFEYNLQFQGEFFSRLFYSAGGAVEKNHLYGIAGTPRLGLTYVPVRPSGKLFHGTRLRANFATGVQEPTLAIEFQSLYTQLLNAGDTADIALYHVTPQSAQRSRTYDVGIDQNILGEKLTLKAGYFHNVFDRQLEGVGNAALAQYFNLNINPGVGLYEAYLNSLAYRAQGEEIELAWQPKPSVLVRGGYTNLDTRVLQSFASDAVAAAEGTPTENPNLPGIAIGAESPLVGARPFRRAPSTGYFDAQYMRRKFTVALKGALASRSDDSTYLGYSDATGGNTLLLPNHDLDFGYVKLDLGMTYAMPHHLLFFTQIDNLLNNQHIGPIGYPGLPLTFRSGLKIRLGGN